MTCELLPKKIVCFYKNEFDEMLCALDSSEYARLFEQNPTPVASKSGKLAKVANLFLASGPHWIYPSNGIFRKKFLT